MSTTRPLRHTGAKLLHPLMLTPLVTYTGLGLSLVSTPMLTQAVGADGRGVIAGSFVLLQVMVWVAYLGLPRGLALSTRQHDAVAGWGVVLLTALGVLGAVLVFVIAPGIAGGDARVETGIRISAVVLPFAGLGILGTEMVLLSGRLVAFNVVRSTVMILPSLGFIIAFMTGTLSLVVAYVLTLLGQVTATVLGVGLALPALLRARRGAVPWSFSLRYWMASALDGVGARLDQLILTATVSVSVLGVYAVAVTCASAAGGLTQALNHWTYSQLSARPDRAGRVLRARTQVGVLLSLASGALVVAATSALDTRLFGADFAGLTPIVAVLVLAQLLHDQWSLRVYHDSARSEGSAMAWSSAVALLVLAVGATALQTLGWLDGVSMAASVVVANAARLGVRTWIQRSRLDRRTGAR